MKLRRMEKIKIPSMQESAGNEAGCSIRIGIGRFCGARFIRL